MNERELLGILSMNIKQHRARLRWSQAELAEKIDISINFLSDIETGKKWASPNTMVKFADAFNVETYELLKPNRIVSDETAHILEKYTEDIRLAIDTVHTTYLDTAHKQ
jgi:transcriptional regulator with XRE-family HTH domain